MDCSHFDAGRCRSCTLLATPYEAQLAAKQQHCVEALGARTELTWLTPVASIDAGFRNKAKMVVAGTTDHPTLGILGQDGGVDLRDCGLHVPAIQAALPVLAAFVTRASLQPYDVARRSGELKFVLVTASPEDRLMIRLVTRSQEPVTRIAKHLPWLLEALPGAAVVSVNLQPEHKAVLEGEREILLTEEESLPMAVNGFPFRLRPQSFFQTNTEVAAALYREAQSWAGESDPRTVWDLYCGVGGFALHLAAPGRTITGIESSIDAIASARQASTDAGLPGLTFEPGDATAWAVAGQLVPDLLVVNPPRRGIGPELADWLQDSGVRRVLYSSCNPVSLARDLAAMPDLVPERGRLFDMFPHTEHSEVLVLLTRA
ncbi:MAG: rRNA methyltransferase [Marmoricola sp.]|nr:rRNA methyltransferase [Marmoricola sp.]